MPTTYAGDPTNYPTSITEPSDGDGPGINAVDVTVPIEGLSDRTAFIKAALQPLASLAALTAIAAPADGLVRHVLGQGWFEFKTAASVGVNDISPFKLAADDLTPGAWTSSTAHETSIIRYVSCSRVKAVTNVAMAPTSGIVAWNPVTSAEITYVGAGSFQVNIASTDATNAWGFLIPIDEVLIKGAKLDTVALNWTPDDSSAPAVMPQMAVIRTPRSGSLPASVHLRAAGFLIDPDPSYVAGSDHTIAYTCDQNNDPINTGAYAYAVLIFDEHGSSASVGNTYHNLSIVMTNIPDARR